MNRPLTIALLLAAAGASQISAQHFDMTQWGHDRGYTEAPYFRYEADNDYCNTNGTRLNQTDDQRFIQSEASNQQAVTIGSGQYVSWTNDTGDANALTLRYSLPYNSSAVIGVYVDNQEVGRMDLNTDHFWEWNPTISGSRDNKPEYYSVHGQQKDWARMRFCEEMCLLNRDISKNQKFELRHISGAEITVDFVEIEKAHRFTEQEARAAGMAIFDGGDLQSFINGHQGQTIYLGERTIHTGGLGVGSAGLQGAGMFYTRIIMSGGGFGEFGTSIRDVRVSGTQTQRYPGAGNDQGPDGYRDIKCFNGRSNNLTIERVLVEFFTCGAWFGVYNGGGADNVTMRHCRIRNNYADGVNFWWGSSNNLVEQCNFRNNGDDDIASWSDGGNSQNNRVVNVTCEHNWRASSIGFFGGGNHSVRNVLIKDGMENGIRLVSDFGGTPFNGPMNYENIAIVHQACIKGQPGQNGDFWGVDEGAFHIEGSKNMDIQGANIKNVDIYDSRGNAFFIGSKNNRLNNIKLEGVRVHGVRDAGSYAFYFENPKGNATFDYVSADGIEPSQLTNLPGAQLVSQGLNNNQFSLDVISRVAIPENLHLSITAISWENASGANLLASTPVINDGDKVRLSLRLENNSDADMPEGLNVVPQFVIDGTAIPAQAISGVGKRQALIVTAEWTARPGGHTLTAEFLDPSNTLAGHISNYSGEVKKFNVEGNGDISTNWQTIPFINNDPFQALALLWKNESRGETVYGRGPINAGDRIRWAAVIGNNSGQNQGRENKLGICYMVDGKDWSNGLMTWNDEYPFSIANGERKLFPANGGGGQAYEGQTIDTWSAENGDHTITVRTNDGGSPKYDYRFPVKVPFAGEMTAFHPVEELSLPDDLTVDTTAIATITADSYANNPFWYTIDGRRLSDRPTAPGLYIHQGRKHLLR